MFLITMIISQILYADSFKWDDSPEQREAESKRQKQEEPKQKTKAGYKWKEKEEPRTEGKTKEYPPKEWQQTHAVDGKLPPDSSKFDEPSLKPIQRKDHKGQQ